MPDKVLWTEGLLVTPQHLQHWDRRLQEHRWLLSRAALGWGGGFLTLELDPDRLAAGQIALRSVRAIFGDGTAVVAPDEDELPAPRPLPSGRVDGPLSVYLGLPTDERARLTPGSRTVEDAFGDHLSREVEVGRLRMQLVLEGERPQGLLLLKVGELLCSAPGAWRWCGQHIPPVLRLRASPALEALLREMLGLVSARRRALLERQAHGTPQELTHADLTAALSLLCLNPLCALLDHALEAPDLHPEVVYLPLRAQVASLTSFVPGLGPADLPALRMEDLAGTFGGLLELLRRALSVAEPVRNVRIPLRTQGPNRWLGDLPAQVDWARAELLLILSGDLPERFGQDQLLSSLKLSASSTSDEIERSAQRGVELLPLERLPPGVAARPGARCFKALRRGPFWHGLMRERELTVYLPNALTSLVPDVVVIP